MEEQMRYYAFISYNSADEKWAKWLQHSLEYYHVPSALCKEYSNLPKKIRPVFWYKQDLSGTKLKDALSKELENSKFLIVICSPDSAKSEWVNDEVLSFIKQGKGDKIIPFIVGGVPHAKNPNEECFPPALLGLKRDEEIRGIDVRRKEGKWHALVDVIATMFGIRFDELWERHKRRRRRIVFWSILSLLAVLAICVAWRVSVKKELITQAKFIAAEAKKLVKEGDRLVSMKLLLYMVKNNKESLKDSDFNSAIHELGNNYEFPEKIYHNETNISSVQFSPDGRYVMIVSTDDISKLLLVESGECVKVFKHKIRSFQPQFSPDGKYIIISESDNTFLIWSVENGDSVQTINYKNNVSLVRFSPNCKLIATTESDHTSKIWSVENGECVHIFNHEGNVSSVQFSPDGRYVVTASWDNTSKIWSVKTGECMHILTHDAWVSSAEFSPDGKHIVTESWDNTSKIWSVENGECIQIIKYGDWRGSVQFSPDGKYVVSASDNTSKIWSVKTGKCVQTLNHKNTVNSAQFSPDGRFVVTASVDNTSRIWSVKTGECIQIMKHEGGVYSAVFSSDGRYVVTASSDNTSKIWSLETGACIQTIQHNTIINSAQFSIDGKYIVTTSGTNVRIISIKSLSEILDKWSEILGPNAELTEEEKARYFLN